MRAAMPADAGLRSPLRRMEGLLKRLRLDTRIELPWVKDVLAWFSVPEVAARSARVNANLAAIAIIAIGFVVQVAATRDRSLTADEALVFNLINLKGPSDAYHSALSDPHPPLFFMLLHFWTRLGHSEFFLRLLPAAFGAGFLWFVYRWASGVFGRASGVLTLVVLTISSAWLPLSAEVRSYSLLLFLSAAALAELEKSVETKSETRLLLASLFLYLAILSHYSAAFVALSFAVYGWIRLRKSRAPRTLIAVWVACQGGVVVVYLVLYLVQLKAFLESDRAAGLRSGSLTEGYFHPERENPAWFVLRQTWVVFRYFFGSTAVTAAALILAVAGVLILAMKKRPAAVLIALPCLFGVTAGLLGLYPFSESRHSVYLLLFVSVAIGVALAALMRARRSMMFVGLAVVVSLFWTERAWATAPRSRIEMNAAVAQLRRKAPAGSLVFADSSTRAILSYYLDRNESAGERFGLEVLEQSNGRNYHIVGPPVWIPDPKSFGSQVESVLRANKLAVGQSLWIVRLGPEYDPAAVLAHLVPNALFPTHLKLGDLWITEMCLLDESEAQISRPPAATVMSGSK